MRIRFLPLLLLAAPVWSANLDGNLDASYGNAGRSFFEFTQSSTPQLQALAKSPTGRIWMFGDDANDRTGLYMARMFTNGLPDTGFGNADGRLRTSVPATLIAQTEALAVTGALVQTDGKPIVFGGLRAVNGETGAFPGVVCRLAAAGNFDASFGTAGCRTLRSFIGTEETCLVEDVAAGTGGTLVVVGNCVGPGFAERPFLARLTAIGGFDTEFGAGAGLVTPLIAAAQANGQHYRAVAVRPDESIVVLGHFTTINGGERDIDIGVLQFDNGGSLDLAFSGDGVVLLRYSSFGGEEADLARDLVLRPDGKAVLLGHTVTPSPGSPHRRALLGQVNVDGSLDSSFGTDGMVNDDFGTDFSASSSFDSIDLDASGRIVVAGARSAATSYSPFRAGTGFRVAIPQGIAPVVNSRMVISSATATSGYVENSAFNVAIPFTVTPGIVTTLTIPMAVEVAGNGNSIEEKALRINAQAPISVQVLAGSPVAIDGYTAIPTDFLDRIYRLMAWDDGIGVSSSLTLAAVQINTQITIIPAISANGHPAGVPYQVTLNGNQTYNLYAPSPADLSGTTITSSRPFAVYGGNSCGLVPTGAVEFCDLLVEQMQPTQAWGSEFVTLPFAGRTAGDVIRVYAGTDGTTVNVNGVLVATLNQGAFYETSRTAAARIVTNPQTMVAQFAKGCKAEANPDPNSCYGDPFMLTVPPTDQWAARFDAVVPQLNASYQHFLGIVAPTSAVGQIRINGQLVPVASFTAIPGTPYSGANVLRAPGLQRVTATQPIAVSVYGFRDSESYGFTAPLAADGEGENSNDVIVRYNPNGTRDTSFGTQGMVLVDHAVAFGSSFPSFDKARRAIVDGGSILVGGMSINASSEQRFFASYRIEGGQLFRDGFEN